MKIIIHRFFAIWMCLLSVSVAFAGSPKPPAPNQKTALPPPPGQPIDENIYLMLFLAVLFGLYMIYRYQLNKKTPI